MRFTIAASRVFFFSVGNYFTLQWLANLSVAATALGQNCMQSEMAHAVLLLMNLLATPLSVIGTNLLCHRYLIEKARVVIKLYDTSALTSHVLSFGSTILITHRFSHISVLDFDFLIAALTTPTTPRSNVWKCWKGLWCGRRGACVLSW